MPSAKYVNVEYTGEDSLLREIGIFVYNHIHMFTSIRFHVNIRNIEKTKKAKYMDNLLN